jgi:linoleoyl-CoA desaturase
MLEVDMQTSRAVSEKEQSQAFAREVKAEVGAYFEQNRLSRHANPAMVVKTVVLSALYFGAYGLIVSGLLPLPWMWVACFVMGIGMAGIGFSVTHDALHGAYSASPRVNQVIGRLFDTLGANGYMWQITHNGIHHTWTNIQGFDEDLEVSPLIRLSPHTPFKPIHRFQHIFAFVAYSLATVFWVFVKDYKYFLQRDLGPYRNKQHPRSEWLFLIASKALYYFAMIAVPLLVLEITWWQLLIGFLTVHLTGGLILGVIFQLAHVVEPTEHLEEDAAGAMKGAWMLYQMRTTNNFARESRLLSWYVGGLNYQIEHHLFPRVCHVHYRQLSPIVERLAKKHGVPYHSCPTLWHAIRSHYRMLKRFGDPGYVPPVRELAWAEPVRGRA